MRPAYSSPAILPIDARKKPLNPLRHRSLDHWLILSTTFWDTSVWLWMMAYFLNTIQELLAIAFKAGRYPIRYGG